MSIHKFTLSASHSSEHLPSRCSVYPWHEAVLSQPPLSLHLHRQVKTYSISAAHIQEITSLGESAQWLSCLFSHCVQGSSLSLHLDAIHLLEPPSMETMQQSQMVRRCNLFTSVQFSCIDTLPIVTGWPWKVALPLLAAGHKLFTGSVKPQYWSGLLCLS